MPATAPTGEAAQALQYAFEKLGEIAHQYGPPAVNAAAEVVKVNAIGNLVAGGVCAVLTAASFYGAIRCGRMARVEGKKDIFDQNDLFLIGGAVGCGVLGLASAILAIIVLCTVCDVWLWTALFNPKLALAHEVMKALAGRAS